MSPQYNTLHYIAIFFLLHFPSSCIARIWHKKCIYEHHRDYLNRDNWVRRRERERNLFLLQYFFFALIIVRSFEHRFLSKLQQSRYTSKSEWCKSYIYNIIKWKLKLISINFKREILKRHKNCSIWGGSLGFCVTHFTYFSLLN